MHVLPKILLIQFRKQSAPAALELESVARELGSEIDLDAVSAFDETVRWADPEAVIAPYAGIIFGGSGDLYFDGARSEADPARTMSYTLLERLRLFLDYVFAHDVPTLGICFGHQLLGAYAGAPVRHDERQSKLRSHEVRVLAEAHDYFLCANLPANFKAQYGHQDVLATVPNGAVLLMEGGECCQVSALRYRERIYTTQFHPELSIDDLRKRIEAVPGYLPEGAILEELFEDAPDAHLILKNFGKLVIANGVQVK